MEKDVYPILDECFAISNDVGVVIVDPNFVYSNARITATLIFYKRYNFKNLEWIYFENNPEECLKNLELRMKKGDTRNVREKIINDAKYYLPPTNTINCKIIPVWRPN